jgi:hypothetical protein
MTKMKSIVMPVKNKNFDSTGSGRERLHGFSMFSACFPPFPSFLCFVPPDTGGHTSHMLAFHPERLCQMV